MNFITSLPVSFLLFFSFYFIFGHSSQDCPLMNDEGLAKYSRLAAMEMEVFKLHLKTLDYDMLPFYAPVGQLNSSCGLFTE